MYKELDGITPPDDWNTLWRYMSLEKFVNMLETKSLGSFLQELINLKIHLKGLHLRHWWSHTENQSNVLYWMKVLQKY